MKLLSVSLALCHLLMLSRAVPLNSSVSTERHGGLCEHAKEHASDLIGAFVPQCDANGNFLPQQCWASTGECWCVDVITGKEIPHTRTPPGTVPVNCKKDNYCPYGWSRYGKQCFVFINDPKTWLEAELYCLFEWANLASIHSYDENNFVQDLTRGDTHDFPETWIGGFDIIMNNHWLWSDGSKFNYNNIGKEDDAMEENEHCLKMNDGYDWKWDPARCNDSLPFVCAKRIWA
ncbi:galactose-specific lectin nattectin-like [Morone saxatilis]|uniref:galactose-specific lectin nattectin-like n=1 Tax=Morone saxatilis TaxID=34816 RepID=UPI0015E206A1|nr:galactose-specific lectin nattectin-like [Morone saxatilis]